MSTRSWLLVGSAVLVASGCLGVACSNGNNFGDGGTDSGGGKDATLDKNVGDSPTNNDGGNPGDSSSGPCTTTAVNGACDIVKQNCGAGMDCAATPDGGGYSTVCIPNTSGSTPEGYACTQSNSNPCVAGLECLSNRCSKHCCLGDDSVCGTSHPEGYTGRCDIEVTVGNSPALYAVCSYSAGCQLFNIQPCTSGETCLPNADTSGTSECVQIVGPDGGLVEGNACVNGNDCKPGLECVGNLDGGAGSFCTWMCYSGGGPFDAGIKSLPAGQGGCPNNETCKNINWGGKGPTWLGLCGK